MTDKPGKKNNPEINQQANQESLLTFPTRFPVKIMGRATPAFHQNIMAIVMQHVDDTQNLDVHERDSGKGNFVSITVTFDAQSQQQLDDLYRALSADEQVLMAL